MRLTELKDVICFDDGIDADELSRFIDSWLCFSCNAENNGCWGADTDESSCVNMNDYVQIALHWGTPVIDPPPAENVWYVDQTAVHGASDGTCWTDAFTDLQDALNNPLLKPGHQIWVAQGTYCPDRGSANRLDAFELPQGVTVLGGFAGTETQADQRDYFLHPSILSGDIDYSNSCSAADSYHVVMCGAADVVLDGFVIEHGNANHGSDFFYQIGGGMYIQDCDPKVSHCIFRGNYAVYGGATGHSRADTQMTHCLFYANTAAYYGGAVKCLNYAEPVLTNCTLTDNVAGVAGNSISVLHSSNPVVVSSILWDVSSIEGRSSQIGVISGTVTIRYSDVALTGGAVYAGVGNLNSDPLFANPMVNDYHLLSLVGRWDKSLQSWVVDSRHSPCIDAGDPTGDYANEPGFQGDRVNMGFFGNSSQASQSR